MHRTPTRRWYPDCWDLPGGHLKAGEAPDVALRRELREELGVDAQITGPPFHRLAEPTFDMSIWVVDRWAGEPANLDLSEHDHLAWLTHREMTARRLAHPRYHELLRSAMRAPWSSSAS